MCNVTGYFCCNKQGRCHKWPRLQFAQGKPQPKASLQLAFVFAEPVLIANAS